MAARRTWSKCTPCAVRCVEWRNRASRCKCIPKESTMNSQSGGIEDLVRQWQDRFRKMMPSRRPPGLLVLTVLALVGWGAWTGYYTVPSDSVAVVQRFGKYLTEV